MLPVGLYLWWCQMCGYGSLEIKNTERIHMEEQHRRRVRYKGTHPRNFEEKYKEHNPEKYADTIEKVIRKGSTPAGMHQGIFLQGRGAA